MNASATFTAMNQAMGLVTDKSGGFGGLGAIPLRPEAPTFS